MGAEQIRQLDIGNTMRRTKVAFYLFVILALDIAGCSDWQYTIQKNGSYVISGRNYTYAIYNSDHRLMTHPIEDLRLQIEYREKVCPNNPITDIYIVSHGWNYTPSEAVANYHNYIQLVDTAIADGLPVIPIVEGEQPCPGPINFQPFFVFITWASTSKPVSEFANSVMPFQFDALLRPITFVIDNGPLFLATAWKQSLNAGANALGRNYPDSYLFRDWYGDKAKYGTNSFYYEDEKTGRDLPVSAIIYELVKCKIKKVDCLLNSQGIKDTKIHLVGHSYGAKVVALAGMEALRRYSLVNILSLPNIDAQTSKSQKEIIRTQYDRIMEDFGHKLKATIPIPFVEQEGPTSALAWWCVPIFGCPAEDMAEKAIEKVHEQIEKSLPIESLVMIDPAMHPGEFWYPTDTIFSYRKAPASILRLIPRKAIVYSKNDFANGTLFNIRELILNTQISQNFHSAQNQIDITLDEALGNGALPVRLLTDVILAPFSLAYSIAYGVMLYTGTTVVNLLDIRQPGDPIHHVLHNDSFGDPKWLDPKHTQERDLFGKGLRYVYNSLDYFAPLYPLGPGRQEDKQGLFRLSRPALGKTGLMRIADGRDPKMNLMGLNSFYAGGTTADYTADVFCRSSYWDKKPSQQLDQIGNVDSDSSRKLIYSFDASTVYDTWNPLIGGSHSDVRDFHENAEKDEGIACEPGQQKLAKRKFSFKFVYRFTKTNFIDSVNRIEQSVLDERQTHYQREYESQGATVLSIQ